MQVLCHDFGAKRAFLLKAAGPAKLLIYFQDFRSFSNPGIRRFLTDLDLSTPPPPPLPLLHPFCSGSPSLSCFLALILLPFAVCQLTYALNMEHTLSHACLGLCVESCGQTSMDLRQQNQSHRTQPTAQHGHMLLNDVHIQSNTTCVLTGRRVCGQFAVLTSHTGTHHCFPYIPPSTHAHTNERTHTTVFCRPADEPGLQEVTTTSQEIVVHNVGFCTDSVNEI